MKPTNPTPSKEALAQAKAKIRENSLGVSQISIALHQRLQDHIPLWHIGFMSQGSDKFEAYFFFETNDELEASKTNGKREEIERVTWEEIERAGRGKPPETKVTFVYDSDENVIENYEGDYQNRLR
jgi:hypothetical protein